MSTDTDGAHLLSLFARGRDLLRRRQEAILGFIPYLLVPGLFLVGYLTIDGYASRISIISILLLSSMLGIASIGQTLTIVIGGIDLSIPWVIGMADVVVTQTYARGWPFWAAAVVAIGWGGVVGAVNGYLSRLLDVYPLVITLATGTIVFGGVLTWTHSGQTGAEPGWLTDAVSVIGKTGPLDVPPIIVAWVVVTALIIVFQRRTAFGRRMYASGDNPSAARLSHINLTRVWVLVFAASGVFAAIGGILLAGFSTTSDATVGEPYLFQTISAVVIGGTSLLGGRGGYGRTVVGALTLTQLTTVLLGAGLSDPMQEALLGILIVALVAIYGREQSVEMKI